MDQAVTLDQQELENYILNAMDRWGVPGLYIAIVKDGKTVITKITGVAVSLLLEDDTIRVFSCRTVTFTRCYNGLHVK